MPTFESFLAEQRERFIDDLKSLVAQPSVAATGQGLPDMAALVQQRLERIGATVQPISTGGAPIIYAEIGSGPRTLLIYNHYDVQPPDPIELWTTPPFEPNVRDGKLYARGVSDNKGDLSCRLQAIEAWQQTSGPLPLTIKWVIEGDCDGGVEARGERWTEPGFFQSYGPYTMSEWIHDSEMTLVKNPFWPGTDAIPTPKIDVIRFGMLDEQAQLAEYEAGNVDRTDGVPLADLDRLKSDPTLSAELSINPSFCTYFYGFNTTAPVVSDVRVRRALSMAVDRQSLIDNVTKGGQEPAQWFARPGLAGSPTMDDHPDLGIKSDAEAAKAELQAYLDETGQTADQLDLTLMFNTSSGHQRIAEAIQQMWKDTLGVNVKVVNQEWAVYLETIKGAATPQIWRLGWCQDYPDANNFDREVFAANGSSNPYTNDKPSGGVFWFNQEFEDLVDQAAVETDNAKRVDLYAQAEDILVNKDAVIIPIYWYARNTCTKPYVVRTFGTGGHENFSKWDILPH